MREFVETMLGGKPTMKKDVAEFVRRCDKCQRFSFYTKSHPETLNSIASP